MESRGSERLHISDGVKGWKLLWGQMQRDLLCVPWRGRAVANSPMLRLDESTVNASSQNQRGREKLGNEKHKTGRRRKRKDVNSTWTKMKKCEVNNKSTAAGAKDEKHRTQSGQLRPDSTVSQCLWERDYLAKPQVCVCVWGVIQRAMAILMSLTVELHMKLVINVQNLQKAWYHPVQGRQHSSIRYSKTFHFKP